MMNKPELELYLHIPFCARKCAYCDFLSFAVPERAYYVYVEKLIEELHSQSRVFGEYQVTSVFIGGGTPSLLPAELMEGLLGVLQGCFTILPEAEITIEANPGTLTMEKLETYLEGGVNRLSIGLQSGDDTELKMLGRIHSYDEFLKSYQRARQAGFTNINVDLMSGLPGQTLLSWRNTLRKIMMLKPEHISAYSLILEEGTPFFERYASRPGGESPPHLRSAEYGESPPHLRSAEYEETDREMYYLTRELLADQGYERYEISNYAKPGYKCRHNLGYWTGVEYLGLGLGASSYTHGYRYHNTVDLNEYLSLDLGQPGIASRNIQELTMEEHMEEFMFLGLRLMQGVSGSEFLSRFGQNMWNVYGTVLEKLTEQGLLEVEAPFIRLTDLGIDVSNMVLSEFLLD